MPAFSFRRKCSWCLQYEAHQRGEVMEVQPVMATPWQRSETDQAPVTMALLAINILVYIMMVAKGVSPSSPTSQDLLRWGANFGPYTMNGEWWRLVTHMFLHIGYFHLAMNMWFLYALGRDCERLMGSVTYALMYLISGIAGGVTSLWWHPHVVSAGASGALFGILGAMIAMLRFGDFGLPKSVVRYALQQMLYCAAINLAIGFVGWIDNAAHIGGFIAGLIIGALVGAVAPQSGAFFRRAVILLFVAGLVGGAVFQVSKTGLSRRGLPKYITLMQQGRTTEAIAELQRQIEKHPENASLRIYLAAVYERDHQPDQAMQQYQAVIAQRPSGDNLRASAEYGIKLLFVSQQKYDEAESYFRQLIAASPNDYGAHYCLAELASERHRSDEAVAEFQKVTSLNPQGVTGYIGLGREYSNLKKYDESIAAYKKAIELSDADEDDVDSLRAELAAVENARNATMTNPALKK